MKKIDKFISYTEQVYRELKTAILSEKLPIEEYLQERAIAEQLGVSRTPVREALKRLEFEGWVETIPWKGIIIKDIDRQDVIEVFQCRLANETFVIQLITETITDGNIADLEEIHNKMKSCLTENREEFISEDRNFHMYLAQLTNNSRLIQFLDNLSEQILRLGLRNIGHQNRASSTLMEHEQIIRALAKRSTAQAVEAMAEHIKRSESALLSILKPQI